MNAWQWQTWDDLPYLTCSLLEPWQHGFFTQHFSPRLPDRIAIALQSDAKVYRVKQVHGNTVLTPTEIDRAIPDYHDRDLLHPLADGILSEESGQSVWVCTADCTPVLIGDAQTGQVAAIHAGWRGTAGRIVPAAIAKFIDSGTSLENLRVAMGPAIAGEVYQVSVEVAAEVGASIIPQDKADSPESILEFLRQLPDSPVLEDPEPGKIRLDVRRVNGIQLEQLGLQPEQIAIAPYCTYQEPDFFFSYRRDRLKNVQWSGIVSIARD
ncbi:MAG TPA: peptidoglycan editing factor PgeF [Cyanobacteria bacterium UBA11166]|nr:peptidoglycan editing factor PgeF [Cyanobacteria bacterium UBA11166]